MEDSLRLNEELPSRDYMYSCRSTWMKEKAAQDQKYLGFDAKYHVVRHKVYDLSSYISKHPGGSFWLEATQGQDVTDLFETHHLNMKLVDGVLSQFYVCDVKRPIQGRFSWHEKGFHKTFKAKASTILGYTTGPTSTMKLYKLGIVMTWVSCFIMSCLMESYIPVFITGFLLHAILGVGHNEMHRGTPHRYLLDLTCHSHKEWIISHCISHHHYPNSKIDFEVVALEPLIYSLSSGSPNSYLFPLYLIPLLCITGLYELAARIVNICRGVQRFAPENLLVPLELLLLMSTHAVKGGLERWVTIHVVCSALLSITALPLHHSSHGIMDGKPLSPPIQDYGAYSILTTQDYSYRFPLLLTLLLFPFYDHRLHHLLPSVDESRLKELASCLSETCEEFGVKNVVYPWPVLLTSTLSKWLGSSMFQQWRDEHNTIQGKDNKIQ